MTDGTVARVGKATIEITQGDITRIAATRSSTPRTAHAGTEIARIVFVLRPGTTEAFSDALDEAQGRASDEGEQIG